MVCDSRGTVLAANRRMKELVVTDRDRWDGGTRCCELLGCGEATADFDSGCLTERSLAARRSLVDVRIDPPRGVTPLVITTTPLCDGGAQVVFEVRPEIEPSVDLPALRIFAMGSLGVENATGPVAGDWLAQRPGELLRFLVCERWRIVPADVIGEAIWPHAGAAAPNTVRHYVHALRERLEPARSACGSTVVCRHGGYGLDAHRIWVDADDLEREARTGAAALAAGRRQAARDHLQRAVALYRGDFLADEPYAEWALRERDRLRGVASDALRGLVELTRGSGSLEYLEQLAELEPLDDDVHRELISAWLDMGRRTRAARHYESFQTRLLREFGARPGFSLAELAQARRPLPLGAVRFGGT